MKRCTIKGIINSKSDAEKFTELLLCDFCMHADAKRLDDAQVVKSLDFDSVENVKCEVCQKTVTDERLEKGI
jgi:hypothetical protein